MTWLFMYLLSTFWIALSGPLFQTHQNLSLLYPQGPFLVDVCFAPRSFSQRRPQCSPQILLGTPQARLPSPPHASLQAPVECWQPSSNSDCGFECNRWCCHDNWGSSFWGWGHVGRFWDLWLLGPSQDPLKNPSLSLCSLLQCCCSHVLLLVSWVQRDILPPNFSEDGVTVTFLLLSQLLYEDLALNNYSLWLPSSLL